MIIIGEKINGAIPSVSDAIENRNEEFIRDLAKRQTDAGADFLDICAGRAVEKEREEMEWLINVVQSEVDTPICIDSPNPNLLKEVMPLVKHKGIVNSISMEGEKCEILLPSIVENGWDVVALTCNNKGVPTDAQTKVAIAFEIIEKAANYGLAPSHIYIDVLVLSLSTVGDSMLNFMEAISQIKEKYPTVKFTSGLSNISFGMPYRKIINQVFLALSMSVGMDSAIVDPTNRDVLATALATDALLNRDCHCRKYNKAYRAGKIGPIKTT